MDFHPPAVLALVDPSAPRVVVPPSTTASCSVLIMHFSQYLYSANRDYIKRGPVVI